MKCRFRFIRFGVPPRQIRNNNMNPQEEQEYQERMGSPEMEYLQYQMENPEMHEDTPTKTDRQDDHATH